MSGNTPVRFAGKGVPYAAAFPVAVLALLARLVSFGALGYTLNNRTHAQSPPDEHVADGLHFSFEPITRSHEDGRVEFGL